MYASDCCDRDEECEGNGERRGELLGVPCEVRLRVIEKEREREREREKQTQQGINVSG